MKAWGAANQLQQKRAMIISKDLFLVGEQDYLRLPKDERRKDTMPPLTDLKPPDLAPRYIMIAIFFSLLNLLILNYICSYFPKILTTNTNIKIGSKIKQFTSLMLFCVGVFYNRPPWNSLLYCKKSKSLKAVKPMPKFAKTSIINQEFAMKLNNQRKETL